MSYEEFAVFDLQNKSQMRSANQLWDQVNHSHVFTL